MNSKCKPPKCKYMADDDKCVKPNAYIEALAWCNRNNISTQVCKESYEKDKQYAQDKACERYAERFVKPTSKSPKSKTKFSSTKSKSPKSISPRLNSQNTPFHNLKQKIAARKIRNFFNTNILNRFETLEGRINYYKYIQNFLKDKKEGYCLERKDYNGKLAYKVGDFLYLIKQIGTNSLFGVVFKTVAKNILLNLVTKLMPSAVKQNVNEVRMNNFLTAIVQRKKSRHFLMSYKTYECTKAETNSLPKIIQSKNYFLVLNELAHGDLSNLLSNSAFLGNLNTMFNIYVQCILSIATLHSYGFIHNDCHWGNFLFHLNKNYIAGYYHYLIYGKSYYLQSSEYNIMIYDYGLVKKHEGNIFSENIAIEDYNRIIPFFMLQGEKSLLDKKEIGVINTNKSNAKLLHQLSSFSQTLHRDIFRKHYAVLEKKKETYVIDFILTEMINYKGQEHIFVDELPIGAKLINENPYIISNNMDDIKSIIPKLLKISGK